MTEIDTSAEALENAALTRARAVHVNPDDATVENEPLPKGVAKTPVKQKSPAEWAYERVVLYLKHFEEKLDKDQEVAMGFAGSQSGSLHIQGMGFYAPDVITFYGAMQDGTKTQLIQHVSQLNVMLRAEPKLREEPVRIGFQLAKALED